MDNNGTLFSTIIALGTGMVIIGLLFGAAIIIAGAVLVIWAVFTVIYWISAAVTYFRERKAVDSNHSR